MDGFVVLGRGECVGSELKKLFPFFIHRHIVYMWHPEVKQRMYRVSVHLCAGAPMAARVDEGVLAAVMHWLWRCEQSLAQRGSSGMVLGDAAPLVCRCPLSVGRWHSFMNQCCSSGRPSRPLLTSGSFRCPAMAMSCDCVRRGAVRVLVSRSSVARGGVPRSGWQS